MVEICLFIIECLYEFQDLPTLLMNAICPTTLQGSQFANGGPRFKRLIVLYLMTALPPYLDRRKDFILEYLGLETRTQPWIKDVWVCDV